MHNSRDVFFGQLSGCERASCVVSCLLIWFYGMLSMMPFTFTHAFSIPLTDTFLNESLLISTECHYQKHHSEVRADVFGCCEVIAKLNK